MPSKISMLYSYVTRDPCLGTEHSANTRGGCSSSYDPIPIDNGVQRFIVIRQWEDVIEELVHHNIVAAERRMTSSEVSDIDGLSPALLSCL